MTPPSFDDPTLPGALETIEIGQIDELPYGVIHLSADGRVLLYSRGEARRSGFGEREALGKDFFRDVAPCLSGPDFRGRIVETAAHGRLDIEIGHTGDFGDPARFIRFRICSAEDGGLWLLTQRE